MRNTLLSHTALGLVVTAAAVMLGEARAQMVPVKYGTDPTLMPSAVMGTPADENLNRTVQYRQPVTTQSPMPQLQQVSTQQPSPQMQPVAAPVPQPVRYAPVQSQMPSAAGGTVSVSAGDTVYALARRYNVAPGEIIAANNLTPPYRLDIGQQLRVPGAPVQMAPPPQQMQAAVSAPQPQAPQAPRYVTVSAPTATMAPQALQYGQPSYQSAPVVERLDTAYRVQQGDTLYSLSQRFSVPVQTLANANGLMPPYPLSIDQRLVIPGTGPMPQSQMSAAPSYAPQAGYSASSDARLAARELGVQAAPTPLPSRQGQQILVSKTAESRFAWPLQGSVIKTFGTSADGLRNDGINIAAPVGAPIRAAADGEVIYTGSELEGYGNLLLIRHADGWVSAYAHADSILVQKGEQVRQGEIVAKVGKSGSVGQPQLHFELRHELQPRDPLAALDGRDMKAAALVQ
ncbi:putative lipoprotein [Parvularcula bermudensis HTCC2503]|uniref:Putative lipoprotein n=1 Tax=Parvularcula bermudensis (strain ATCC BAA-594 / HTCC2503 / KCTC 12087) TaxID=314260 RepID=E0THA2_PARBH|nr:peptidoglycan DD-metalloendopeptidase family protein [Parvularcula bermudensis]ADM10192.1 putative lipoprotein [Parvularcula bermudensis HTCC2503]